MRKIVFFAFVVIFGLSVQVSFAQITPVLGLGGRIITAPIPGIICPAGKQPGSPFMIAPSIGAPVGPFIGDYNSVSNFHLLLPGIWFLGLYSSVPLPECATQSAPPAPVSGFRTLIHGTSVQVGGI